MQNPSTFKVYNASAGSGKTFTLVKEYLKVLLTSQDIFTFQKVLAITFTNKAAGEMKERVLHNLQSFANNESTEILQKILDETKLEKEIVKKRSDKILEAILQNYSAFSITTIDSFTHKIIRSFAYDLGLSLNFEVELDSQTLLNEVVELLISKIGTDKKLTKLLVNYSLEKADDDKSWDISRDLNEFSKILLKEDDIPHFRNLIDKDVEDFISLKSKLLKHQKELSVQFKNVGSKFQEILQENQLSQNDFVRGSIPKFFSDIAQKGFNFSYLTRSETIKKAIENHQYYTKSTSQETAQTIENIVPEIVKKFNEAKAIYSQFSLNNLALKSIIPLAVLNNINNELNQIKEDNNIQLNAEFNQLISDYLQEQPAAFIYERIGQRFQHYFIDEMQDTSVLQWQNLVPLIDNVLSQENSNLLLVGDGKQAIYRWRGGKAEQFIDLSTGDENPFQVDKKLKNLDTNFRSYSEIVNFNNAFFSHSSNFLQDNSYKNLYILGNKQEENDKKGGFVSLSFLEKNDDKNLQELRFAQSTLDRINELKSEFSLGEICILTRKRKEGITIANYLSENGIPIVSSETLLLQNSSLVVFIIDFLRLVQIPTDQETRFEVLYFLHQHLDIKESKNNFFLNHIQQETNAFFESLQQYGIYFSVSNFHQLPFYEKVEEIINVFKLINSSNAYLQFFLDVVLEQQNKGADVADFLDFWDQKKEVLSIVISENKNAVKIMTIHKSKGLQFPVVIFPCDLDIYKQINPKVWLDNLPDNFNGFNELLVSYNKNLESINDRSLAIYNQQKEALELDNMNLLYVALTRAVEQLHIITDKRLVGKNKQEDLKYYSGFFINYLKTKNLWDTEKGIYEFGIAKRHSKPKIKNDLAEAQKQFISNHWSQQNLVLLANSSKLWENKEQQDARNFGNLIHEIFAEIISYKDVDVVLQKYLKRGFLDDSSFESINKLFKSVIFHTDLKQYYSNNDVIYNEREIITLDGQIIIPDRLVFHSSKEVTVIDYKTGERFLAHHQQIQKYGNVLSEMNFKVIKMLLVYCNEIIDVIEVLSKK